MRLLSAIISLLCALCILGPLPARAEAVAGLYEAGVPAESQDAAARDAALRKVFEAVLVKVAGSRRVLDNPEVAAAVSAAPRSVVQFYFKRAEYPPDEGGPPAPTMLLHASFQPAAVQDLLRRAGEPMLSANRPGTLLWLVVDNGSARHIVNHDSDAVNAAWLALHASERALPLVFPMLDLEDSAAITPEQAWELDPVALASASSRYAPESVLAGRLLRSSGGEWIGEWRQQFGEETLHGQGRATSLAVLHGQLIDFATEALAARFAIRAELESAEELRVRVDGVRSFAAHREVTTLLRQLGSVRESHLALIEQDSVHFDLLTDSGIDSVLRELGLITQLQPVGDPAEHRFTWAGK